MHLIGNGKNSRSDKSIGRSREIWEADAEDISAVHRISSILLKMPKIRDRINQSEDPQKYLPSGSDT